MSERIIVALLMVFCFLFLLADSTRNMGERPEQYGHTSSEWRIESLERQLNGFQDKISGKLGDWQSHHGWIRNVRVIFWSSQNAQTKGYQR